MIGDYQTFNLDLSNSSCVEEVVDAIVQHRIEKYQDKIDELEELVSDLKDEIEDLKHEE